MQKKETQASSAETCQLAREYTPIIIKLRILSADIRACVSEKLSSVPYTHLLIYKKEKKRKKKASFVHGSSLIEAAATFLRPSMPRLNRGHEFWCLPFIFRYFLSWRCPFLSWSRPKPGSWKTYLIHLASLKGFGPQKILMPSHVKSSTIVTIRLPKTVHSLLIE